jgi:hypothetical protein
VKASELEFIENLTAASIQAEIGCITKLIRHAEGDLRNIKSNLGIEQALISNLEAELKQVVDNFEQNKK